MCISDFDKAKGHLFLVLDEMNRSLDGIIIFYHLKYQFGEKYTVWD